MSVDIRVEAIYKDKKVNFVLPPKEHNIDIDFEGMAMIQAIHVGYGEMKLTGNAMDGYGIPLKLSPTDVTFKVLN